MKSILTVTALLAVLAAPALAEEAMTPPPAPQAVAPAAELIVPAAVPQPGSAGEPAMSVPASEPGMTKASGGGCSRGKTVYLTN